MRKISFYERVRRLFVPSWPSKLILSLMLFALEASSAFTAEREVSQLTSSIDYIRQVDLYQNEINDLEEQHGPYDRALLEPLGELANLYVENGILDRADSLLDRQLQLLHVSEGPDTFSQISILQ